MEDYRNKKNIELAIEVPNDYDLVVEIIKRELDCPLPIREGEKFYPLKYKLIGLWKEIVKAHSIDCEWYHVYDDDDERDYELSEDYLEELYPIAVNLTTWINIARAKFLDITKPIQSLIADQSIYNKHILIKPCDLNEIKQLAITTNTSFLFLEITTSIVADILNQTTKQFFEPIIKLNKVRFSVVCDKLIGVTNKGFETDCLMVEIDCIRAVAHAYPCNRVEAQNNVQEYTMLNCDRYDYWEPEDGDAYLELEIKLTTEYKFSTHDDHQ